MTNKEDFIEFMLSSSDYNKLDIMEFTDNYFENLLSLEKNMDNFIIIYNSNKIKTATLALENLLSWSDRIGSDEIAEINNIIKLLKT